MITPSFVISMLSLAVSCYALYRRGPVGPKGDVGDTGARGPQGETTVKPVERARLATPKVEADTRPVFLSKEERREQIAEQAYNEDYQTRLIEIRERLHKGSGLIDVDHDANTNQMPDWRKRNMR